MSSGFFLSVFDFFELFPGHFRFSEMSVVDGLFIEGKRYDLFSFIIGKGAFAVGSDDFDAVDLC